MDRPIPGPERRLSLARAIRRDVQPLSRHKGYEYFASGAVQSLDATSDTHVSAIVRGSRPYHVFLARDRDAYVASCECPFFVDRRVICKHVWALALAADRDGLLPPLRPETRIRPSDESSGGNPFPPRASLPDDAHRAEPSRPPDPWQRFLEGVLQRAAATAGPQPAPRYVGGEFMYVVDKPTASHGQGVAVRVMWRQRRKNGEWGKPQPASIGPHEIAQLTDPVDREILATLLGAADAYPTSVHDSLAGRAAFRLQGPITDRALWLLASSRRFYLRPDPYPSEALRPVSADSGPAWVFRLEVETAEDGGYRLAGSLARGHERMDLGEPQLVLDSGHLIARGSLARLEHGGAFAWLEQLRRSGPATFPVGALPALSEAVARSEVNPAILPASLQYETVDGVPRFRLQVRRVESYGAFEGDEHEELEAAVTFDYEGTLVPPFVGGPVYAPGMRRLIRRDRAAERIAVDRLIQLGFERVLGYSGPNGRLFILTTKFERAAWTLIDEGWHIEAEGVAFRRAMAMRIQVKSGIDWFELHGNVEFGGGRSAPLTSLLDSIERRDKTVVLDDGTLGVVPEEWLRRYARIAGFGEVEGEHVRFRPSQAALLDALLENQPSVDVDETFRRARAEMQSFRGVDVVPVSSTFRGTLREYQHEALGWFEFLRRFGFGGCLADDMGLGKTVMVLALLDARRQDQPGGRRPSLAVVPRSLVFNWMAEARRFAPSLRVLDYTGPDRSHAAIADYDLVLTTYGTLRRDAARLNEQEFDYLVLDEAQAIKNAATASAKAVRLLRGRHRLALSGTPVENHIGELWSIFEFLNPGLLGTSAAFRRASSVQTRHGGEDLALVARALKPLILRRTKEQVAPELPSRTEQTIVCELDEAQRGFYDDLRAQYRQSLLARVERDGLSRSKIHVLEALLRLRQAACHPGLVDRRREEHASTKFDVLLPQLIEVIAEGHKALVFSQFTELLRLLKRELDRAKVVYEYLDGRTKDRGTRVERFSSDPDCRVFLISLKAGGLGLNLTAAEYVFLLDPWWNPAAEAQAIDRAHRIGQSRHVFAYRLIAKDTVEEKVMQLQASKRELADAILTADPALIRNLKTEDLELLLS